jgi:hypothetical protein
MPAKHPKAATSAAHISARKICMYRARAGAIATGSGGDGTGVPSSHRADAIVHQATGGNSIGRSGPYGVRCRSIACTALLK